MAVFFILGNKDDSKEVDKPASSKDTTTTSAVSASASGEMAENSNTNQSAMMSEGHDDSDSKGKDCELCSQCYQAYVFSSSKFSVIWIWIWSTITSFFDIETPVSKKVFKSGDTAAPDQNFSLKKLFSNFHNIATTGA